MVGGSKSSGILVESNTSLVILEFDMRSYETPATRYERFAAISQADRLRSTGSGLGHVGR
jgi:hypothetical protein